MSDLHNDIDGIAVARYELFALGCRVLLKGRMNSCTDNGKRIEIDLWMRNRYIMLTTLHLHLRSLFNNANISRTHISKTTKIETHYSRQNFLVQCHRTLKAMRA